MIPHNVTYRKRERNSFWLAMFGQNILYCIISTGLMYYYQSVIFVPVAFIGVLISLVQVLDAVKDPIMGVIIDKTRSKHGKCKLYLLIGVPLTVVFTILPFINGTYGQQNSNTVNHWILIWTFVSYLLWTMIFTLIDVPLWSLSSCMTKDAKQRDTLLAGARVFASIAGGLVPLLIIPLAQLLGQHLSASFGNTLGLKYGVIIVTIILAILGGLLMLPNNFFSVERTGVPSETKLSLKELVNRIRECSPYMRLLLSGILRSPIMILSIAEMTLFSYYFGDNGAKSYTIYMVILGGGYIIGQIVAMALTPKCLSFIKKKTLYILTSLISALSFLLLWTLYCIVPTQLNETKYLTIFAILFFVDGCGTGILNLLQSIMITDCIDYEENRNGDRLDGVFMSGQSFIIKLSTGIATIIMTVIYNIVGFSGSTIAYINDLLYAGASFRMDAMFHPYRSAIFFVCSIPPCIGMLLSVIPMIRYGIPQNKSR